MLMVWNLLALLLSRLMLPVYPTFFGVATWHLKQ
jgi:hypothetical protein